MNFLGDPSGEAITDLHWEVIGKSPLPAICVLMVNAKPSIACVFLDHPFDDRFIIRSRVDIVEVGLVSSSEGGTREGLGLACRIEMNMLIALGESVLGCNSYKRRTSSGT